MLPAAFLVSWEIRLFTMQGRSINGSDKLIFLTSDGMGQEIGLGGSCFPQKRENGNYVFVCFLFSFLCWWDGWVSLFISLLTITVKSEGRGSGREGWCGHKEQGRKKKNKQRSGGKSLNYKPLVRTLGWPIQE